MNARWVLWEDLAPRMGGKSSVSGQSFAYACTVPNGFARIWNSSVFSLWFRLYLAFEMYFMCVLFDMPWTNFALVLSFYFHANIMAFCVTFRIPFPKNNQTSYTNTHSHALKYLFLVRFECLITIDSCAAKKLYAFVSIPTKWWIMARPTLWM